VSSEGLTSLPQPAVGWPAFLALTALYFAMNYLILGGLFLTIGAQASTPREVQTLSLPITVLQIFIFGFAMSAVGRDAGWLSFAAGAFPLSSPLVMIARAAESPDIVPHIAAVLWQALWVGLILRWGARFFRSRVLKSGPTRGLFRKSAKT
jgi:ABC-2 type transport system permease protein